MWKLNCTAGDKSDDLLEDLEEKLQAMRVGDDFGGGLINEYLCFGAMCNIMSCDLKDPAMFWCVCMQERDDIGENIYITELRKRKKYRHAKVLMFHKHSPSNLIDLIYFCWHVLICPSYQDGKWVKTVLTEDVKDFAGPDRVGTGDMRMGLRAPVLRRVEGGVWLENDSLTLQETIRLRCRRICTCRIGIDGTRASSWALTAWGRACTWTRSMRTC